MTVCIIGSGLSALTLAKALVNKKIYVEIFMSKKKNQINKSRTIGISKSNFEYFNKNIINIEKLIWQLKKIEIFSENLKNEKILDFENNNEQLFSILKNYQLHDLLINSLSNNKFCKKKTIKKKYLDLDNYNIIINTDHSNFLTKKYFNKKIIKSYNSSAYTTIIDHEIQSNDTATQIFTKNGPLAFLPISKNKTSLVYSVHDFKKNNKENIKKLILKHNFKYKIKKIQKLEKFELKSYSLRTYHHKKILAFGDLLHKIHPLAGQGFNMTIRDVKFLMEIINERKSLGLPLDYMINSKFEKKMRHTNYIFSNSIDLIHELFNLERKSKSKILSKTIKLIGKNPKLNKVFKKIADQGVNL